MILRSGSLPWPRAAWAMALGVALTLAAFLTSDSRDRAGATGLFYARTPVATPASALERLAKQAPARRVEVIVQLRAGHEVAEGRTLVETAGGTITRDLPLIDGLGAELTAGSAAKLARDPALRAVSLNGRVTPSGAGYELNANRLRTAFVDSVGAGRVWKGKAAERTGLGVGVAVIDTGVDGSLVDFRAEQGGGGSRVVATALTNPRARTAEDTYGHGTHVAGLIAGNGFNRAKKDKLRGRYAGVAPKAHLVSVKAADEDGGASVMDVIDGLQFVVDHKDRFGIRVVNLSLNSTTAESYTTDPLDAAVEEAWFRGLVVVAAAGNRGARADAVSYAPGNDPYVITAGGVDDGASKKVGDDRLADWSSRGVTQDGMTKPEVLAPGAHLDSTLAPASEFARDCPTCVRDGEYLRIGGTSMATAVISGAVALLLEEHPDWTPDQVKGALVESSRDVPGVGREVDVHAALKGTGHALANQGLTPSTFIDPATGGIDLSRTRWSRTRWSDATELLRTRWSGATFTCAGCADRESGDAVDESRTRWSRTRWSASFTK